MPPRRELPFASFRREFAGPDGHYLGEPEFIGRMAVGMAEQRPETAIQALMECAPHDEPDLSLEELLPLRDVLADAIDLCLDGRQRWVFEALVIRGESLRSLGRELALSKTHVARLRDEAISLLRTVLEDHPLIERHLNGEA